MIDLSDTRDWEQEMGWEINMGPDHVYEEGKTYAFQLTPNKDGELPYYEVTFEDGEMDDAWRGCRLYWRGQSRAAWVNRKLTKWSKSLEYEYDKTIESYLLKVDTDTLRLEGEIEVKGKKEAVTMFLGKEAVRDGALRPLLIIITRTRFPWSQPRAALNQDGTAHAKPR
jgi:hypothetical protein